MGAITNRQLLDEVQKLNQNRAESCPYRDDIRDTKNLLQETHDLVKKMHRRMFEENGESLVAEIRRHNNDIDDLKNIVIKSNGKTGKTIAGKDTGDLWKYGFRLATIVAYILAFLLGIDNIFLK